MTLDYTTKTKIVEINCRDTKVNTDIVYNSCDFMKFLR